MASSGKKSGSVKGGRRRDLLLACAAVCLVALLAQNRYHDAEQERLRLETEQKLELVIEDSKKAADTFLKAVPVAFVEGLKNPYAPREERRNRMELGILNTQVQDEPDDADLYLKRAAIHWALHESPETFEDINKVISLKPKESAGFAARSYYLRESGEYEAALVDIDRAIEIEPELPGLLYSRAVTHGKAENYKEAVADFEQLVIKAPKDTAEWKNSGAYYQAKDGRFEEALLGIQESLELRPNDANSFDTLGYILVGLGRYQEAVQAYEKALAADPESTHALRGRAVAYKKLGKTDLAQADLREQVKLDPNFCLHWRLEVDPGAHEPDKSLKLP